MVHDVVNNVVDRVVDALDHAGENKARLHHVLVRVHADDEVRRAAILFSLLLNCIERAEARVAGGSKDHVGAFADLGQRELFTLARIVPRAVSYTDVVLDHADVWAHRLRALFVTFRETMNEPDVHPAEKTDGPCFRRLRREYADEIRTLMFFKDERSYVREFADAIDNGELDVRIILRHLLHDRRLRETHSDDQIEISFSKRAHRRLNRVRRAGFNVTQDNRQIFGRALHAFPRRRIERAIVLSADVKNNADM